MSETATLVSTHTQVFTFDGTSPPRAKPAFVSAEECEKFLREHSLSKDDVIALMEKSFESGKEVDWESVARCFDKPVEECKEWCSVIYSSLRNAADHSKANSPSNTPSMKPTPTALLPKPIPAPKPVAFIPTTAVLSSGASSIFSTLSKSLLDQDKVKVHSISTSNKPPMATEISPNFRDASGIPTKLSGVVPPGVATPRYNMSAVQGAPSANSPTGMGKEMQGITTITIGPNGESTTDPQTKKRRHRRPASEINKVYKCRVPTCPKSYGSEGALKVHVKTKHPGVDYKTLCPPFQPPPTVTTTGSPMVIESNSPNGNTSPTEEQIRREKLQAQLLKRMAAQEQIQPKQAPVLVFPTTVPYVFSTVDKESQQPPQQTLPPPPQRHEEKPSANNAAHYPLPPTPISANKPKTDITGSKVLPLPVPTQPAHFSRNLAPLPPRPVYYGRPEVQMSESQPYTQGNDILPPLSTLLSAVSVVTSRPYQQPQYHPAALARLPAMHRHYRGAYDQAPIRREEPRRVEIPIRAPEAENDEVCAICEEGGEILMCDGPCNRSFHLKCLGLTKAPDDPQWFCANCRAQTYQCFMCKKYGRVEVSNRGVMKCKAKTCGRYYHIHCAYEFVGHGLGKFTCPLHYCETCHSYCDVNDSMRCFRCPIAYHIDCMPNVAATLGEKLMICSKHEDESLPLPRLNRKRTVPSRYRDAMDGTYDKEIEQLSDEEDDDFEDRSQPVQVKRKRLRSPIYRRRAIGISADSEESGVSSSDSDSKEPMEELLIAVEEDFSSAPPSPSNDKQVVDKEAAIAIMDLWH